MEAIHHELDGCLQIPNYVQDVHATAGIGTYADDLQLPTTIQGTYKAPQLID